MISVDQPGWILLRAWNDAAHPLVFDLYPYATTSPVYLSVDGSTPTSTDDAEYFIAWIDRIRESVEAHGDFNSADEQRSILTNLQEAQQRFEACR